MIKPLSNALILRHLEDVQDFRVEDRNTPILPEELKKIPGIVATISKELQGSEKTIRLISSPQLRAQHTLEAVVEGLAELLPEISVISETDTRIRDLYHGKYNVPTEYVVGEKLPAVSLANKVYVLETFKKKNLDYRNGDPLDGLYPELEGLFDEVGENQRNFSIRFYEFVYEFLERINNNPDTIYILVTHTAIVFRFFELIALFDECEALEQWPIKPGELTFYEWNSIHHLEHAPDKLFVYPGDVKHTDLSALLKNRQRFLTEIDYLRS